MRHRSAQSGFTLIEVVVALAIAALGLSLLMAAASTGLGNAHLADQYDRSDAACAIPSRRTWSDRAARSGSCGPATTAAAFRGEAGFLRLCCMASRPARCSKPIGLYTVEVTISWRTGNSIKNVSLRSQRVASQ